MIFIDANIPMYLVGAAHPHKQDAARLLEHAAAAGECLVTDVEVLQEILHRYTAIDRRGAIQDAFDAMSAVLDEVFQIDLAAVDHARSLIQSYGGPVGATRSTLATMQHSVARIMSFDAGRSNSRLVRGGG